MKFVISGAYPKKNISRFKEGYRYEEAFLNLLNWESGVYERELCYKSPPEHRNIDATQMFKTGTIYKEDIIIPSSTEILFINIKGFEIRKVISLPSFNDLHHVTVKDGLLYIANTGAEVIQIIDFDGNIIKEFHQAENPTWKKLKKGTDLRFSGSMKPHEIHLNFIFFVDGDSWFTRFMQRDAIALNNPKKRIDLGYSNGKPHDGLVVGDYIYFTLTDGFIVIVNKSTFKTEEIIDLNEISKKKYQLGWCRGIEVIGKDAYVGFSSIRKSKFVEYGKWIVHGKKQLPARIAQYNLINKQLINEVVLSNRDAAIFMVRNVEI